MIAGIELGKHYVQMSVKTDSMKEPESVTWSAGTEEYELSTEADLTIDKNALFELFRKVWKVLCAYGSKDSIQYLVFCLMEDSEQQKENLIKLMRAYDIPLEKVKFLERSECFCAYVMNQRPELSAQCALLIENNEERKFLLRKYVGKNRTTTQVLQVSEKSMKEIFSKHSISSVFLVGDDFEEAWMQEHLELLKSGKRVFAGKNLFVNGAVYRGTELAKATDGYLYLDEQTVCCDIGILALKDKTQTVTTIAFGGKNWKDADTSVEVMMPEDQTLELYALPMNGQEKITAKVFLENLPARPKKTTRLQVALKFQSPSKVRYEVKDLGFGELFPNSGMIYEGELQWEQ